jgi:hypothetical protein
MFRIMPDNPRWGEFAIRRIDFESLKGREMYVSISLHRVMFGWRVHVYCTYKDDAFPIPVWNLCLGMNIPELNLTYNIVHGMILSHMDEIKSKGRLPHMFNFSVGPICNSEEWDVFIASHLRYIKPSELIVFDAKTLESYLSY